VKGAVSAVPIYTFCREFTSVTGASEVVFFAQFCARQSAVQSVLSKKALVELSLPLSWSSATGGGMTT